MKLLIQAIAEEDILQQVEWYAEQDLPDVAQRFSDAVTSSLRAMMAGPQLGPPKRIQNAALNGLRSWAVKGFQVRIYYLVRDDLLQVIRVLHAKRDTDSLLDPVPG